MEEKVPHLTLTYKETSSRKVTDGEREFIYQDHARPDEGKAEYNTVKKETLLLVDQSEDHGTHFPEGGHGKAKLIADQTQLTSNYALGGSKGDESGCHIKRQASRGRNLPPRH